MSERYEKLQEIGSNMWVTDCPVMLYKGVLIHDNQLNRNLLQLGFEMIANSCIAGIEITYQGYSLGEELIVDGEYSYLDLNLQINDKVGSKSPIYLDDNNARIFHITVKRIFFSDKTTWENDRELHALESQEELKGKLGDVYEEFRDIYDEFRHLHHHQGLGKPLLVPEFEDTYWRCVCGTLNESGSICRQCSINKIQLDSLLDIDMLYEKKLERKREQERLAEEKKERMRKKTEEKILAKKRLRKGFVLLAFAGVLTVLAVLGVNKIVLPFMDYQSAVSKMDERKYDEGLAMLRELSGYKDSDKLIKKYALDAVVYYTDEENYVDAFAIAKKYHVTDEKAICYLKGLSKIKNNQYLLAWDYLKRCNGYKKADEKIQWLIYSLGCEEMRKGNLGEAYNYFSEIDSAYQDTAKRQATCKKYMKYCKSWTTIDSHTSNFSFQFKVKVADNEEPKMYYVISSFEDRVSLPKNNMVTWDYGKKTFDFAKGIFREKLSRGDKNTYRCKTND